MSNNTIPAPIALMPKTAADELVDYVGILLDVAAKTAERTDQKLMPIMRPNDVLEGKILAERQDYPPLFNILRERLEGIESSIDIINKALDRVEI